MGRQKRSYSKYQKHVLVHVKIADQLKTEFTAGTAPDVFVIEGQAGYDLWKDNLQPLKGDWIDKTEFDSNKETMFMDSQLLLKVTV